MILQSKKIAILSLLLALFGYSYFFTVMYSNQPAKDALRHELMEPSHWRTFCVGHYAVDFPTKYLFYSNYRMLFYQYIRMKRLHDIHNPDELKVKITQYIEMLNTKPTNPFHEEWSEPRKDGKKHIVRTVDYPNGGIGILTYHPLLEDTSSKKLHSFLVTKNPYRVYLMYDDRIHSDTNDQNEHLAIERVQKFAQMLHGREEYALPPEGGYCIDGGYLQGDIANLQEQLSLTMRLPYYGTNQNGDNYGVLLALDTENKFDPDDPNPFNIVDRITMQSFLRYRKKEILGGKTGYDIAYIPKERYQPSQIPSYNLFWFYNGRSESTLHAEASFGMGIGKFNIPDPYKGMQHPYYLQFSNADQVLAIWDKILTSAQYLPGTNHHPKKELP